MNQKQEALLRLPLTNAEREWLTGRLEMLSVKESYQLSAALMRSGRLQELMGKDSEELQATVLRMKPDVAVEAINCLMTLHDYEVCHPAGSYEALGHFFLQYESGVPKEALPFVDLAQLGRRYEDLHPGLFIGGSYVIYPTKEPEQPYTGHNLAELDDSDWSVRLKIASPEKPEGVWVRLPDYSLVNDDRAGEVELALLELKVDTIQECTLLDARCVLPEVKDLVSEYREVADLIYDGNDLGFLLDEQGQGMPHFSEKFHAALAYEKCTRLGAALDIAQNLRCYDFVPKEEIESFTEKYLESMGIEAGHMSLLSECMDRESYGRYLLAQQGYQQHAASGSFIRRNQLDFCYEHSQPPVPRAQFEMKL